MLKGRRDFMIEEVEKFQEEENNARKKRLALEKELATNNLKADTVTKRLLSIANVKNHNQKAKDADQRLNDHKNVHKTLNFGKNCKFILPSKL